MAEMEYEQVAAPCEFGDRAGRFMTNVITLSRDFPDLFVEAQDKTERDLTANSWACKKSAQQNKPILFKKVFAAGIEKDMNSLNEMLVLITIHANDRDRMQNFKKLIRDLSKQYGGKKTDEDNKTDPNAPKDGYRYFCYQDYTFRG